MLLRRFRTHLARRRRTQGLAAVTLDGARTRAAAGAAFLDRADPGWHARLDSGTLALADGGACVLGQLHGAYRLGLFRARVFDGSSAPALGSAFVSPVDLGFHAQPGIGEAEEALDYALLTRAWREELGRRSTPQPEAPASIASGSRIAPQRRQ